VELGLLLGDLYTENGMKMVIFVIPACAGMTGKKRPIHLHFQYSGLGGRGDGGVMSRAIFNTFYGEGLLL
jgi:hypothetical protein